MGYVDGKTDLDLILAEDKTDEEDELLQTSQVHKNNVMTLLQSLYKSLSVMPRCNERFTTEATVDDR